MGVEASVGAGGPVVTSLGCKFKTTLRQVIPEASDNSGTLDRVWFFDGLRCRRQLDLAGSCVSAPPPWGYPEPSPRPPTCHSTDGTARDPIAARKLHPLTYPASALNSQLWLRGLTRPRPKAFRCTSDQRCLYLPPVRNASPALPPPASFDCVPLTEFL